MMDRPGLRDYLPGATYVGFDGGVAAFGQQDAAANTAAAAIRAIFMVCLKF
jgi:hypothetical protein